MANFLLVLLALCVALAPSIVASEYKDDTFFLKGFVYCDTCRCGYETSASKCLPGAVVKLECISRASSEITFTKEAVTDSSGHYQMLVHGDRGDDLCDMVLVKSSDPECSSPSQGRDKARVILTKDNGMNSNTRFANAMGFLKNNPLPSCREVLKQYEDDSEE